MKVLLLSGGIESTCLALHWAPDVCLTFDYGQVSASGEVTASRLIAKQLGLEHEVVRLNLRDFGLGMLAGKPRAVGKLPEYWPFRNQMLVTLALMRLWRVPNIQLALGTVRGDRKHPDGTLKFLRSLRRTIESQRPDFTLMYPAAKLNSEELIVQSNISDQLLGFTFSCYASSLPCGRCQGCVKNLQMREWVLAKSNSNGPKSRKAARPTTQAQVSSSRSKPRQRVRD